MNMTRNIGKVAATLTAAAVVFIGGCTAQQTSTMKEAKQAAKTRWQDARSGILFSLAQQQFDGGDLEKAEATCSQAMEQSQPHAEFYELLARIAVERGQLERAIHTLELADKLDPKRPTVHYLMGVIFQRWQRYDAALAQYEIAYKMTPDNVERLLAVAETLVKLNRSDEAVKRLTEKLDYFENNATIRVTLGRIHLLERRLELAVKYFKDAAVLSSEDPTVLEQLAMAELAIGQYGPCVETLRQLMLQPAAADRTDLKIALGDCYSAMNKPVEARGVFLEITRQRPGDVDAWVKLGQVAWLVEDYIRVEQAAERITALAPDRYEGYMFRGMLERSLGNIDKAIAQFDRASVVAPSNAAPLIMRGLMLEQTGDMKGAIASYQRALKASPNDDHAKRLLAGVETK
jgi:tetratricopeptide (TPR) repeat protein